MEGLDLASRVTTRERVLVGQPAARRITSWRMTLESSATFCACSPTTIAASRSCRRRRRAAKRSALEPNGVFLSNGPGDPAAVSYAPDTVRAIADSGVPIFGICLGHQILGLTYGAHTVKMPYGHRGGNHPVKDLATGRVLITSQNHGFAVAGDADERFRARRSSK